MFLKLGRLRATVGSWKVNDVIISFQLRFQLDQTAKYMFANEKKNSKFSKQKNKHFYIHLFPRIAIWVYFNISYLISNFDKFPEGSFHKVGRPPFRLVASHYILVAHRPSGNNCTDQNFVVLWLIWSETEIGFSYFRTFLSLDHQIEAVINYSWIAPSREKPCSDGFGLDFSWHFVVHFVVMDVLRDSSPLGVKFWISPKRQRWRVEPILSKCKSSSISWFYGRWKLFLCRQIRCLEPCIIYMNVCRWRCD